jgi:hypothetical protein
MDTRSSATEPASEAVAQRRAFRAFVRAHHPDIGGDPTVFAATVAAYRARQRDQPARPGAAVTVYRRGGLLAQLSRQWRRRRVRRLYSRVR